MNPLVAEYKTLAPDSDSLPDNAVDNLRKLDILPLLEKDIDVPEVAQLLLEILANPREFELPRIEAIKLVGIFVTESKFTLRQFKGAAAANFLRRERG